MAATRTCIALFAVLAVSACSGGKAAAPSAAPASTSPSAAAANPGGGQRQGAPGVSGIVAAVSGKTLQVQNDTSQTAVTYGTSTALTQSVPATAADVVVGMCAVVRSATTASGTATPAATAPAAPAAPAPTAVTASTVVLSPALNGTCAGGLGGFGGFGGFGGGFRGGPGATATDGSVPTDQPARVRPPGAGGRGGGFGGAVGIVTAVSSSGFIVANVAFPRGAATGGDASSSPPPTTSVAVSTTGATTYTKDAQATSSAIKAGVCVTARGTADSSGTLAATAIAIRPAVNGACATGFGGPNA